MPPSRPGEITSQGLNFNWWEKYNFQVSYSITRHCHMRYFMKALFRDAFPWGAWYDSQGNLTPIQPDPAYVAERLSRANRRAIRDLMQFIRNAIHPNGGFYLQMYEELTRKAANLILQPDGLQSIEWVLLNADQYHLLQGFEYTIAALDLPPISASGYN